MPELRAIPQLTCRENCLPAIRKLTQESTKSRAQETTSPSEHCLGNTAAVLFVPLTHLSDPFLEIQRLSRDTATGSQTGLICAFSPTPI